VGVCGGGRAAQQAAVIVLHRRCAPFPRPRGRAPELDAQPEQGLRQLPLHLQLHGRVAAAAAAVLGHAPDLGVEPLEPQLHLARERVDPRAGRAAALVEADQQRLGVAPGARGARGGGLVVLRMRTCEGARVFVGVSRGPLVEPAGRPLTRAAWRCAP
jgi:hypothetical protein